MTEMKEISQNVAAVIIIITAVDYYSTLLHDVCISSLCIHHETEVNDDAGDDNENENTENNKNWMNH